MLLKINGLNFSIEGNQILDDFNLQLNLKGITAILGTNGSGKSTLLSLIAGYLQPSSGSLYLNETKIIGPDFKLIPGHPEIALVRQDMRLTPYATVRENLSHVLRTYDENGQKLHINKLSRLLGFENYLDKTLKFLSGGEQQRISIAAALANNPSLLLLDEPFSQTDINLKSQLKIHLRNIVDEIGVKILFVTHDPQEALSMADNILILQNGKIIEEGDSRELYYKPKYKITAELTGHCNWIKSKSQFFKNAMTVEGEYLVRPDQLEISNQKNENSFKAKVHKIEFCGLYNFIYLQVDQEEIYLKTAQISNTNIVLGQIVYLNIVKQLMN
ncbi:MAG: ABC transporter ATP-binding protein [Opitutaceae bacterium]|nr:ABC transporter ATP-binding protein [Cytophagales bacterium]